MRSVLPVLMLAACAATPGLAHAADSADDVCGSDDPCVVRGEIDVAPGSTLDFGLRTLRIEGSGRMDFTGRAMVLCGRFEAETSGTAIRARAGDESAHLAIRATGDIDLGGAATAAGLRSDSDGGALVFESTQGAVRVAATIDASGGGGGCGGDVSIVAATDAVVGARVLATGGEYDGGSVSIDAGRDVAIFGDLRVDSVAGAGFGGQIDVVAGRDLELDGEAVLGADGHQSADHYAGDGGSMSLEAGRDIRIFRDAKLVARAAAPDGFGDTLEIAAGGDVTIDGDVIAKGLGVLGGGALVDIAAGGQIRIGPYAELELTGTAAGGDLMMESTGTTTFDGRADVSGGTEGLGGRIVAVAGGDFFQRGEWTTAGAVSSFSVGELFIEACHVHVDGTLANAASAGLSRIVARESAQVRGAVFASGDGGTSSIEYRLAEVPPVLEGHLSPEPSLAVDASLAPCPGCEAGSCGDDYVTDELCGDAVRVVLEPVRVRLGDGRMTGKGEAAAWWLDRDLAATGLRIVVAGTGPQPLADVTLPAGSLERRRGSWRLARTDDAQAPVEKLSIVLAGGRTARVRVKLRGLPPDDAVGPSIRVAVSFGDEPDRTVCLRSRELECDGANDRMTCASRL